MYPSHLITIGRTVIAYDGREAFTALLFSRGGGLVPHSTHTRWIPSPRHDLRAPCAVLHRVGDGGLAYDTEGNAYEVGVDCARLDDLLTWDTFAAKRRAARDNADYVQMMRAKFSA